MSVTTITVSGTGQSASIATDLRFYFNGLGVLFSVPNGVTVNADLLLGGSPDTGPWAPHDTLVGMTASKAAGITLPVGALALKVNSISGGSVQLTVIQSDY